MIKTIQDKIETYKTILIFRHSEADYDALGSQLGLKALIQENYPDKKVYALGRDNQFDTLGKMDHLEEFDESRSLAIVVDVAQKHRIDDQRFLKCEEIIVIDHHQNDSDCATIFWQDKKAIAAAEMVTLLAISLNWKFSIQSAKALMMGLVSDSGRFLFNGTRVESFEAAATLLNQGIDLDEIYQTMYTENIEMKRLRGYGLSTFTLLDSGIAFLRNAPDIKRRFNVSEFSVSRGLVSVMGQIKGVHAWVNFTESDEGEILTEIRSASVPLDDVAKSYGGGGHQLACGCTLQHWSQTQELINAIEKKVGTHDLK
jgi:bifunctional oligoribonuclease and PAP phosphatase NrnA